MIELKQVGHGDAEVSYGTEKPRYRAIAAQIDKGPLMTREQSERFLAKLSVGRDDECWLWKASTHDGYGKFKIARRMMLSHRLAWEWQYGPIPAGLCVLHHCDVSLCNNPLHLFLGTRADNNRDMTRKGRGVTGRLTRIQVEEIIFLYHERRLPIAEVGRLYGIHSSHVYYLVRTAGGRTQTD